MSDTRLCSCVKRKYTRDLEKRIENGAFCQYCRNKLNPDQSADCYFFGPDTSEDIIQEQLVRSDNQETQPMVTDTADPDTSLE